MSGVLRLGNTGAGTGRSTLEASASNDQTFTLPSAGGTILTSNFSNPGGTITLNGADIVITNANVNINGGDLVIDEATGNITIGGNLTLTGDFIGDLDVDGNITATGSIVATNNLPGTRPDATLSNQGFLLGTRYNAFNAAGQPVWVGHYDNFAGTQIETSRIESNGTATFAGDIQSTSQNGGQLAGFRNFIINGDFRIWQRGTSFTSLAPFTSLSRYSADQCLVYLSGFTTGDSLDQATITPTFGINTAFESNVAGGTTFLTLPIELDAEGETTPFIEGETYTLSYYANKDDINLASIAGMNYKNIGEGGNTGTAWTQPNQGIREDVGSGWYRYSQQFVCQPCNANARMAFVSRSISDGVQITGFQLERGPVATPFEHRPIGTELALCQRYFRKYTATNNGYSGIFTHTPVNTSGTGGSETAWNCYIGILGEMRIPNPSTSFGGGNTTRFDLKARNGGAAVAVDSIACADFSKGIFYITTTTATDPSTKPQLRGNGSSSTGWFGLSAEL